MKKDRVIDNNMTIFAGKVTGCQKFNIIQRDKSLELVFDEAGVFKTSSNRILIKGFAGAYSFQTVTGDSTQLVTDTTNDVIRLIGKKRKALNMPKIFPKEIPVWNNCVDKSKEWSFPSPENLSERVIDYYSMDGFEGVVVYNAADPTLPDYEALTQLFGKRFNYLGASVRFKSGSDNIGSIISNILRKKKKDYVAYKTETGDVVITEEKNEDRIFREIALPNDPEEAEADFLDNSTAKMMLEMLSQVLSTGQEVKQIKSDEISRTQQLDELCSKVETLSRRIAFLEKMVSLERANKKEHQVLDYFTGEELQ